MAPNSPTDSLSPTTKRVVLYLFLILLAIYVYHQKQEGERIERSVREIYEARENGRESIRRALESFRKRVGVP